MADDFDDQDFDFEDVDETGGDTGDEPSEESGNRRFWIIVGILAIITLIVLICITVFYFIRQNSGATGGRAQQQTQAAIAYAQQTEQAVAAAQTLEASSWTATPTVTPNPTNTPTPTQVVVQATDTPDSANVSLTQTVEALLTLAAQSTPVNTSTALPTQLPDTGFADDFAGGAGGFAGLIGLAVLAVVLIFLARRLRASST